MISLTEKNKFLKQRIDCRLKSDKESVLSKEDEKNTKDAKSLNSLLSLQFSIILYSRILQRYFVNHYETLNLKRTYFDTDAGLREVIEKIYKPAINLDTYINELKCVKQANSNKVADCLTNLDFKDHGENLAVDILKCIELNGDYDDDKFSLSLEKDDKFALQLEHIYPQIKRKSNKFYKCSGDHLRCLGNLSLLEKCINSNISNKDYNEKSKGYANSRLGMAKQISCSSMPWNKKENEFWTDEKITLRGQWLAKEFMKF